VSKKGLRALEGELRAKPPAGLGALNAAALEDLAEAIAGARRRQAEELARAGDQALRNIPRLLRGPIRSMFR